MWPTAVEHIAIFLRASGVEGRLEELLGGAVFPPGVRLRTTAFECDGRLVVALVPASRTVDRAKVQAEAGCAAIHPTVVPDFPFQGGRVFVEQTALTSPMVWLEAGSARHVLGLAPSQLARLTRAEPADLARRPGTGEVDDGVPG